MLTPLEITVRPMTDADLDQVLAIETVSFPAPWIREHFANELTACHSFPYVAISGGNVVGYVCLMSIFEEAQILDIAVDPGHRGRGVAATLIQYAMMVAGHKEAEFMRLEVRDSNSAAIALYEKLGFARAGVRPRYYEGRDGAVLMEKKLKETP